MAWIATLLLVHWRGASNSRYKIYPDILTPGCSGSTAPSQYNTITGPAIFVWHLDILRPALNVSRLYSHHHQLRSCARADRPYPTLRSTSLCSFPQDPAAAGRPLRNLTQMGPEVTSQLCVHGLVRWSHAPSVRT